MYILSRKMKEQEVFIPYRRFDCWQVAQQYVEILEKKEIVYKLEEYPKDANVAFYNLTPEKEFLIKLRQDDFEKVDNFILQTTEINDLAPNHYLYSFTDEELIEILEKPYEWSEIDRTFAPKLLTNRGYDLSKLDIEGKKEKYVEQLTKGKEASEWMIMLGYFSALLGGLLGLAMGWCLVRMKTTLPNGKQVYTYNEKCRKNGERMVIISVVVIIITIVIRIIIKTFN